jgi:hypothetical protein
LSFVRADDATSDDMVMTGEPGSIAGNDAIANVPAVTPIRQAILPSRNAPDGGLYTTREFRDARRQCVLDLCISRFKRERDFSVLSKLGAGRTHPARHTEPHQGHHDRTRTARADCAP